MKIIYFELEPEDSNDSWYWEINQIDSKSHNIGCNIDWISFKYIFRPYLNFF